MHEKEHVMYILSKLRIWQHGSNSNNLLEKASFLNYLDV